MSLNQSIIDGELESPPIVGIWGREESTVMMLLRHYPGPRTIKSSFIVLGVIPYDTPKGKKLMSENFQQGQYLSINGKSKGVSTVELDGRPIKVPAIAIEEWGGTRNTGDSNNTHTGRYQNTQPQAAV